MKKYVLLILFVVLISGCTGQRPVTTDPNRGLTITEFVANPPSVTAGETVLFDVGIENIGGTKATNVQVDLFGVENQWRDEFGTLIADTLTNDIGTLKPPQPILNVAGDSRAVQYTLMTPPIPQGIPNTAVSVEARVTYDYNTTGFIDIPALSIDEKRRMDINGEAVSAPTVVNSAGPIKMSMDPKYSPIIVDTTDTEEDVIIAPLTIILTNVGDGFPITPDDPAGIRGAGGKISGAIRLLGPAEFYDCLGVTGGTELDLDSAAVAVKIRQDKTAPIHCTISIDKNEWNNRPSDSVKLIFELFYRYYVSKSVSVQVSGK